MLNSWHLINSETPSLLLISSEKKSFCCSPEMPNVTYITDISAVLNVFLTQNFAKIGYLLEDLHNLYKNCCTNWHDMIGLGTFSTKKKNEKMREFFPSRGSLGTTCL